MKTLIEQYKHIIRKSSLKQELYKWQLVQRFQGKPDLATNDLYTEIKGIDYANLIYQLGRSVMVLLAKEHSESYRLCLQQLFDENLPLSQRIVTFINQVQKIYREIDPKQGTHHDERTIATLLTYKYPDKYTFYKDSFYQKYCKLLGVEAKGKNEKYPHYLELVKDLIKNYISKDAELLQLVQAYMPDDAYPDEKHLILAQDILYQVFQENISVNYWIFQCNPDYFDIETALKNNLIDAWTITAHKEKIKIGDKVILWVTGKNAACYALAEVNREPMIRDIDEKDANLWKEERSKDSLIVGIKITYNLVNSPIYHADIKQNLALGNLKAGYPGTNFAATQNEYQTFLNIAQNKMTPKMEIKLTPPLNQILYGPPGTGKTYHTINEALAIIEQKSLENLEKEARKDLKKRFDSYVQKGQILFCTFHQSMSYEDFIEGIKPITREEQVMYEVQDGIFKLICERAGRKKEILNFEEVYEQFTQDTLDKPIEIKTLKRKSPFEVEVRKNGECWVLTRGEKESKVTYYKETLKVFLTEETSYTDPYLPAICEYLQTYYGLKVVSAKQLPYILIIDEINRGNVSQIFGELITLIEESKRNGETEALSIMLPYSKKTFSVPNNLYLIGTMNTADRSVEALDTALRRRFVFKEMLPNASLLKSCEGIDLQQLLIKINERLTALLSKEHCIGHAYFMNCQCRADVENAFYQKILPLLQEYFYGDLGKMQLVIGEDFVQIDNVQPAIFMKSRNNIGNLPEKITFLKPQNFVASIQKIYL